MKNNDITTSFKLVYNYEKQKYDLQAEIKTIRNGIPCEINLNYDMIKKLNKALNQIIKDVEYKNENQTHNNK